MGTLGGGGWVMLDTVIVKERNIDAGQTCHFEKSVSSIPVSLAPGQL